MLIRTEGIVLRSRDYGEADLLVTYLTPDMGVKKAFAKSPKKIKSRFGSSLEPLTHARIALMGKEDTALPRLTQSDIISPHQGLRENYRCFALASEMAELTEGLITEKTRAEDAFDLMKLMLARMEQSCTELNALIYKFRILKLKGYAPALSCCARCRAEAHTFYPAEGAVLCPRCHRGPGEGYPLSAGSVKVYEALTDWSIDKTPRLKASPHMVGQLNSILTAHIEHLLCRQIKSRQCLGPA